MKYEEALSHINSLLRFGVKPGLERISALLDHFGNPHDSLKFIHVAGTNGKGSVCAFLAEICKTAGKKTGLFTSPYVIDFRERMQINNEFIPINTLVKLTEKLKSVCEKENIEITEFEFITALALCWFKEENCDIVVLETGLGGRLDSTNVVTPLISIITKISYDHMEILGDTIEKIAFEKAGIIKKNTPVVLYPIQKNGVTELIKNTCETNNAPLIIPEIILPDIKIPLEGEHQKYNAITAFAAAEALSFPYDIIKKGIEKTALPARLEIISKNPLIILDGAHNPDGAAALINYVQSQNTPFTAIIGMMADKNIDEIIKIISPRIDSFITVDINNPRAIKACDLSIKLPNAKAAKTHQEAINLAIKERKAIAIFGSLYLAGEIREKLFEIGKN